MRVKLTNIICISLISLSVAISATSSANAGYRSGSAMEGTTTGGGGIDGNTTGGGSTVYKDQIDDEMVRSCYDDVVFAIYTCELENQLLGGGGGKALEECTIDAFDEYLTCMCSAGLEEACDIYAGLEAQDHTSHPQATEVYDETDRARRIYDKLDQPAGNIKVNNQLAPDTRTPTKRRHSHRIKDRDGVAKR